LALDVLGGAGLAAGLTLRHLDRQYFDEDIRSADRPDRMRPVTPLICAGVPNARAEFDLAGRAEITLSGGPSAKIADMASYEITPEQASQGQLLPDRELVMLGAHWLAAGYESPALLELASLGAADLREARGLFETALTELGHPRAGSVDGWHGHWSFIDWARNQADRTHTPYAAAQRVLEVIGDVPELWEPGRGPEIMSVLNQWDVNLADRPALDDEIRTYLWSLSADDCPPD
jgi:hypothetical protein